jgi:tetratricopeptide (TPR) repeat protein
MATSEIEKLERRYAENPHGLTFAPLAEVHRKNGDIARALELLTAGLELHPNYIPASIVLGRCHQDLGDLSAAEAAFAHVLRLDDENVIALKSLADINERLERFEDAKRWLRRLVSVDRSNEEAREQLERLEGVQDGRPSASTEAGALKTEAGELETEAGALEMEAGALEFVEIDRGPAQEVSQPEVSASEPSDRKPEQVSSAQLTDADESDTDLVTPLPGLETQEFQPPAEAIGTPAELLDIDVETSGEVVLEGSGSSEFRVPNAAEDFREAQTPARRSYAARDTHGQSVAAFFRSMLANRPPGGDVKAADSRPGGEASNRQLQDGLSLSVVLGPSAKQTSASSEVGPEEAVSFDDFFGAHTKGAEGEKSADAGKDDLDQFHSWLQNLKR